MPGTPGSTFTQPGAHYLVISSYFQSGSKSKAPLLEPIIDEDKEDRIDEELEEKAAEGAAVVEAGLSPADALTVPTRVRDGG